MKNTVKPVDTEDKYIKTFGVPLPVPIGVDYSEVCTVAEKFIRAGSPIPDDFDWYDDIPEGAVV